MQNISHYFVYGTMRNMISGAGLSYAIEREKYTEVPLTIFFPSIYAGYHLFKNKDDVIKTIKDITKRKLW
jgi:hypothetical protein